MEVYLSSTLSKNALATVAIFVSKMLLTKIEQKSYTLSMKLLIKPKPNKKYFDLPAKEATFLAWELAKEYSLDDKPDMTVFREFAGEYSKRYKKRGQLSLI
jgi:hypothetical protein